MSKSIDDIRVLGRVNKDGIMLKAHSRHEKEDTKLVEVDKKSVKKYGIMIYFPSDIDLDDQKDIVGLINCLTETTFKMSYDKYDRVYWYRVTKKRGINSNSKDRDEWKGDKEYYEAKKKQYPSMKNDPDAEHWIDMAEDVGCDPQTLKDNWD